MIALSSESSFRGSTTWYSSSSSSLRSVSCVRVHGDSSLITSERKMFSFCSQQSRAYITDTSHVAMPVETLGQAWKIGWRVYVRCYVLGSRPVTVGSPSVLAVFSGTFLAK
jgi:vacuolar-type H+-ATPase subunit B/Vma2